MIDTVSSYAIVAFAPPPPAGTQADPRAQMMQTFGMLIFMIVLMYLLMFRPQQKKAKEHAAMMQNLKPGDKVVTNGGILGVVISLKDKSVTLRSADTKLEVLKSSIGEVLEKAGSSES